MNPQKQGRRRSSGFPRDSWVDDPRGRRANRINTALKTRRARARRRDGRAVTGIPIDYYLLTDFEGFSRMVDGIGGMDVDVPYAMSDPYSGAVLHARAGTT